MQPPGEFSNSKIILDLTLIFIQIHHPFDFFGVFLEGS